MDPMRVHKLAGEGCRPGRRGDWTCDSSWWSGVLPTSPPTSGEPGDGAALERQHRNEEWDGHDHTDVHDRAVDAASTNLSSPELG